MTSFGTIVTVAGVGLFTTSAVIIGATLGLYAKLSRKVLACVLAFAAGVLVSSLGIELAFHGALELREREFTAPFAWAFISGGFALGATIYYTASRFLDRRGAAVRSATRFREYVLERKQEDIELLAKCELLRHLPPEAIEKLLAYVEERHVNAGETLFRAGDPGDALYIVARGRVSVLHDTTMDGQTSEQQIAELGEGNAFGEMALLSGASRTATVRAATDADLLRIGRGDFDKLIATDQQFATSLQRLSHSRAISNLSSGGTDPAKWAKVATSSLENLSRRETDKMLSEAGRGAGIAIILGDLLDTIPGLVVVGAKFTTLETLSLTVMMGIFIGGIPESAASAALLRKAGFSPRRIYSFWSFTLVAGMLSAVAGKLLIGSSESLAAIFAEAMAGGSLLALVTHAMIPEALHQGGSLIVLPTVAGFLLALYLILINTLM
jgi:CRP-like cAMP-binding protein